MRLALTTVTVFPLPFELSEVEALPRSMPFDFAQGERRWGDVN